MKLLSHIIVAKNLTYKFEETSMIERFILSFLLRVLLGVNSFARANTGGPSTEFRPQTYFLSLTDCFLLFKKNVLNVL